MGHGVVTVDRVSWEKYKYAYDESKDIITSRVVASYTQFPLMPAWAVTIHKSQGKTMLTVRIDLGDGAFAPGQTYVALSRARRLEDIWLGRAIKKDDVFCDERIRMFYARLFNRPIDHRLSRPPHPPLPAIANEPGRVIPLRAPPTAAPSNPRIAVLTR